MRQGITNKPISRLPYNLSGRPLHTRLNGMEWLFEAYVRLLAGCQKWGSGILSEAQKRNISKAESTLKDELQKVRFN